MTYYLISGEISDGRLPPARRITAADRQRALDLVLAADLGLYVSDEGVLAVKRDARDGRQIVSRSADLAHLAPDGEALRPTSASVVLAVLLTTEPITAQEAFARAMPSRQLPTTASADAIFRSGRAAVDIKLAGDTWRSTRKVSGANGESDRYHCDFGWAAGAGLGAASTPISVAICWSLSDDRSALVPTAVCEEPAKPKAPPAVPTGAPSTSTAVTADVPAHGTRQSGYLENSREAQRPLELPVPHRRVPGEPDVGAGNSKPAVELPAPAEMVVARTQQVHSPTGRQAIEGNGHGPKPQRRLPIPSIPFNPATLLHWEGLFVELVDAVFDPASDEAILCIRAWHDLKTGPLLGRISLQIALSLRDRPGFLFYGLPRGHEEGRLVSREGEYYPHLALPTIVLAAGDECPWVATSLWMPHGPRSGPDLPGDVMYPSVIFAKGGRSQAVVITANLRTWCDDLNRLRVPRVNLLPK